MYRVRKDGHYQHGEKITVLMATEAGDPNLPDETYGYVVHPCWWVRCVQQTGTTAVIFHDFIEHIIEQIEEHGINGTDDHQVFMWDNLRAHGSPYVHQLVAGQPGPRQFSIIFQPPYHPQFGPIDKYKICDVCQELLAKRKEKYWTMETLEQQIHMMANFIWPFD